MRVTILGCGTSGGVPRVGGKGGGGEWGAASPADPRNRRRRCSILVQDGGKTNEPAYVAHTAAKVAELKGISLSELEAATTDNFFRLFAKAERARCA